MSKSCRVCPEPSELTALAVGITSHLVPKTFCTLKQPTVQQSPLPAHPIGARTQDCPEHPPDTCQAPIPEWEKMGNSHSGLWKHICRGWRAAGPGSSARCGVEAALP